MPRADPPLSRARSGRTSQEADTRIGEPQVSGAWSGTIVPDDGEDDLVGATLCDTYQIDRVLGEGGMGRVYLARHTRIQRKRFAIKTLHPEYLRRPDLVARFQREAEAAAAIQSEHVVGVYDVDATPDGRPFLVAELLAGKELGDLLDERGKLSIPYAVRIVRQLCKGLSAAHAEGVVHRDIKPENVFLTGDLSAPLAKVLDFGISRLEEGGGEAALTKTGMIMGTPAYMPPEQARGERVDQRADIYAVGAILYRALTGQLPFDRSDASAIVLAVLTQEPPRPRSIDPSIPEHLEAVIQRAMAKDPSERFASMDELSEALALHDLAPPPAHDAASGSVVGPRSAALTRGTLGDQAREVRDARPHFILLVLVAAFALVAGLFTALSGAVQLSRGSGLSGTEIAVGIVAALATLSTPAVLWIMRLRRSAWDNSLRMLELVEAWRRPLFAGSATYGLGWLGVALLDHSTTERGRWPGWDLWLFLVALLAAVATAWLRSRRSAAPHGGAHVTSALSSPVATIPMAAALLASVILGALALRDGAPIVVASGSEDDQGSAAGTQTEPAAQASADDLAAAKRAGVEALSALAERYPADPQVLRELVLAQGAEPAGLAAALDTIERLHPLAPKMLLERPIEEIVVGAARTSSELRGRALAILAERMGARGTDLLYDLSRPGSAARSEAQALLAQGEVRGRASKALRIALDLEQAQGCGAKAALLDRVESDGDERSVAILEPLTIGRSSGCGFLKLGACPAQCGSDAGRMRKAIQTVRARSAAKE